MKLHKDKKLYKNIIRAAANHYKTRTSVVEKDYYVSYLLKELTDNIPNILFKGGTSLSKCFGVIKRFSEDIDLNIITDEIKVGNRVKRNLKDTIIKTIQELNMELLNPDDIRSRRDFNRYDVGYNKVFGSDNTLKQYIMIETFLPIKSFPYEIRSATNFVYDYLKDQNDLKLIDKYELHPFDIRTQSIVRTFIDKIFAICDYHEMKRYDKYSRHLYDIHKIWEVSKFELTEFVALFYDVAKERHNSRPNINLSSASGYKIINTINDIIEQDVFKNDYQNNTIYLIQDDVRYQQVKQTLIQIIDLGILPETVE